MTIIIIIIIIITRYLTTRSRDLSGQSSSSLPPLLTVFKMPGPAQDKAAGRPQTVPTAEEEVRERARARESENDDQPTV